MTYSKSITTEMAAIAVGKRRKYSKNDRNFHFCRTDWFSELCDLISKDFLNIYDNYLKNEHYLYRIRLSELLDEPNIHFWSF